MLRLAVCLGVTASLAAAVLGAALVRRRLAVVEITGLSMEPVLSSGDRVLVRRARLSELRPGLVVVVEMPRTDTDDPEPPPGRPPGHRTWMIKRVAALPGDPLPGGVPSPGPDPDHPGPVPPGMFVVLGDNPTWSYDSRKFGCIPAERLLGVMIRPLQGHSQKRPGESAAARGVGVELAGAVGGADQLTHPDERHHRKHAADDEADENPESYHSAPFR